MNPYEPPITDVEPNEPQSVKRPPQIPLGVSISLSAATSTFVVVVVWILLSGNW